MWKFPWIIEYEAFFLLMLLLQRWGFTKHICVIDLGAIASKLGLPTLVLYQTDYQVWNRRFMIGNSDTETRKLSKYQLTAPMASTVITTASVSPLTGKLALPTTTGFQCRRQFVVESNPSGIIEMSGFIPSEHHLIMLTWTQMTNMLRYNGSSHSRRRMEYVRFRNNFVDIARSHQTWNICWYNHLQIANLWWRDWGSRPLTHQSHFITLRVQQTWALFSNILL